jgi:hypothetical protein
MPAEKKSGNKLTERFNGTLRAKLSRLVRHSYSFAKSFDAFVGSIENMIYGYNPPLMPSTLAKRNPISFIRLDLALTVSE